MVRIPSVDSQRRRAIRSLKIAHAAHSLGNYTTLAWLAKGLSSSELTPEDMQRFQQARQIIHDNRGRLKRGDVERLLAKWEGRK
jgi:heme exporter protein D